MAAVANIPRLPDRRKLTAYLGLDPKVKQSGEARPATVTYPGSDQAAHATRSSSRAGRPSANAAPIAGFYARVQARRGHSIAIVASARNLACLFWCLLTRDEDYAFAQPALTTKKMRRLEITAGAPRWQGGRDIWSTNDAMRQAERNHARQAQRAYERTIKTAKPTTRARARHRGAHRKGRQAAQQRGTPQRPSDLAFAPSATRTRPALLTGAARDPHDLTSSGPASAGSGGGVRRGR